MRQGENSELYFEDDELKMVLLRESARTPATARVVSVVTWDDLPYASGWLTDLGNSRYKIIPVAGNALASEDEEFPEGATVEHRDVDSFMIEWRCERADGRKFASRRTITLKAHPRECYGCEL